MDPVMFFGRSRSSRLALNPKGPLCNEGNVNCEVTTSPESSCAPRTRAATKLVDSRQQNVLGKKLPSKAIGSKGLKSIACEDKTAVKGKKQTSSKSKKEKLNEQEKEVTGKHQRSGPVYQHVDELGEIGDSCDVYDFPADENAEPVKKKKSRKATTVKSKKKEHGCVMWDPSKRPFFKKIESCKPLKTKVQKAMVTTELGSSKKLHPQLLKPTKNLLAKKQEAPTSSTSEKPFLNQIGDGTDSLAKSLKPPEVSLSTPPVLSPNSCRPETEMQIKPALSKKLQPLKSAVGVQKKSPIKFSVEERIAAAPLSVHGKSQKCEVLISNAFHNSPSKVQTCGSGLKKVTASAASSRRSSVCRMATNFNDHVGSPSITTSEVSSPLFPAVDHFTSTPNTSSQNRLDSFVNAKAVKCNQVESLSNSHLPSKCLRKPTTVPVISVRESPSFIESEFSVNSACIISEGEHTSKSLDCVISTPVTSKTAKNYNREVTFPVSLNSASTPSASKVVESPVPDMKSPGKSPWAPKNVDSSSDCSGLFDNFPHTSVIPTRMFSTHRGTIFNPNSGINVAKGNLPTLSPDKASKISRPTTVKFSVPPSAMNVNNCFGFDEDDNEQFSDVLPRLVAKDLGGPVAVPQRRQDMKPNLPIEDVKAILRGQLRLASPASTTPRTIQTKLTDFVSSTPPSTRSRGTEKTQMNILTPTPVPLFGEDEMEKELPSPFVQQSRRSYDRFHPRKRIACGDEVHSDEEDGVVSVPDTLSAVGVKKKSRSYKKKKKPSDNQLDVWANELASHFDEVDDVELQVE